MSPASKQVDIDARWLYWRMFLLFFFVFEMIVWQRVQRLPMRSAWTPRDRVSFCSAGPRRAPWSWRSSLAARSHCWRC